MQCYVLRRLHDPEGEVKQEVLRGLAGIGAYYFMPVQTGFGKRTVDILACYKGRFIAIECKRAEGGCLRRYNGTCCVPLRPVVASG